jgi:DNA-binding XRE family transcriptional regulator
MQALARIPHTLENGMPVEFTISGDIPVFYLDLTRRLFPATVVEKNDDPLMDVRDCDWYKDAKESITPGYNLRLMRQLRKMTQQELADKLGISKQQISNMEKGRSPIGKKMAMRLGKALNRPYGNFFW